MKWEYRGLGWQSTRCKFYVVREDSHEVNSCGVSGVSPASGNPNAHYFEAVPLTLSDMMKDSNFPDQLSPVFEKFNIPVDLKAEAASHKAPLYLIPSHPMHETSFVMKSGADKYEPWNFRHKPIKCSTYRSSMQRHLDQWFDGLEDADHETGRSHLAHVIANACILMDAAKHGTLIDDRPIKP
jgi:hypothetical protein